MIGRFRSDADLPAPHISTAESRCVPLQFDHESGDWVPLIEGDPFMSELDAARVCAADLRGRWLQVVRAAKLVRALCDHPEFEFSYDGIDDDLVRAAVRALELVIHGCEEDFARLLDHPGDEDTVRVADSVACGDSKTGYVRPK